jgi:sulfide:quinone oxidoreductase
MKPRVLILGAGFGGLELSTTLSQTLKDEADITLIDRSDAFVFGYSKLDVLFGRKTVPEVRVPYSGFRQPNARLLREEITAIDPAARRVTTNRGTHEAEYLVIALGADYDAPATPGLVLGKNEFYTVEGAAHLRDLLPNFSKGRAVVGVCAAPYKCPPAPSECALMLHDYLVGRGVRGDCEITLVNPLSSPVPPSPDTSKALIAEFAERKIAYLPNRRIASIEADRVVLDDGTALGCDLFLGIPKNRAPDVVVASGLTEGGWVTVDQRTLETKHPGVFAVGDLANSGTPKAGLFAEVAARVVAKNIVSMIRSQQPTAKNPGQGACYIEFGAGRVARVEVDFFSGPKPTGSFVPPTETMMADKQEFGSSRRARWFAGN